MPFEIKDNTIKPVYVRAVDTKNLGLYRYKVTNSLYFRVGGRFVYFDRVGHVGIIELEVFLKNKADVEVFEELAPGQASVTITP